ncbi:uridine kinase family protein [Acutalibacter caecimuris]|uniref:uridine kinase family protein n=1 Tax=Acutalibacter caecimuris TaxID=3093657 RepID=UPI002AC95F5D|nr:hypothetical protein [Acutalibacter sp. M00118]
MKKPYIIGIAGGSASGKSTFSNWLENTLSGLDLQVFHMDSYFKPAEVRPKAAAPITGKVYLDDNCPETIFHEKLREDLAQAVAAGHDVILVEGLYALWYDWLYAQLDLKLFIDCQADERIVRRLKRNMTQWGLQFDEIAAVYLDMVRYRHQQYIEPTKWRADFILNGSSPSQLAGQMLAEHIRSQVTTD